MAEFDAPLDLILHLISKHKLDIVDIDISSLLDQYLLIIEGWQETDLEVSSEFLAMASRLVYMKTVNLLPKHEAEIEQLKKELAGQLIEYRIIKVAAELLQQENQYHDIFVRQPLEIELDNTYNHLHSANLLYNALVDAMGRDSKKKPPSSDRFENIVSHPIVSVSSKIISIMRILRVSSSVTLQELFDLEQGRSALVATFLAVLELLKSGRLALEQEILSFSSKKTYHEGKI